MGHVFLVPGQTHRLSVDATCEPSEVDRMVRELEATDRPPRNGRARPLLAVAEWSPALADVSTDRRVDLVVSVKDRQRFRELQAERRRAEAPWRELRPADREAADRLAGLAGKGGLVPFIGAGVSKGAGQPTWGELLREVGETVGLLPSHLEDFERLSPLDRATVLQHRLGDRSLGEAVAAAIRRRPAQHALGHALLAALPAAESVTTNYDECFEQAADDVGRPRIVLAGGEPTPGQSLLLKLHGTVSRPERIVVTREDVFGFQDTQKALAGIVQGYLLTRQVLFVGFSLSDDNFHHIVHAARTAEMPSRRFGTAIVVDPHPFARDLWGDELTWIELEAATRPERERLVEIFLDRLLTSVDDG